ncbi:MAG: transposase [Muribaculaceae bacterium]|nr:transposase [Muribaculaceae bacterium]
MKVLQFCVMPDHIHLLLQVLFHSDKHLDFYINTLKENIAAKYSYIRKNTFSRAEIASDRKNFSKAEITSDSKNFSKGEIASDGKNFSGEEIFESGYCDKPLYDDRSLDGLFQYIRHNPHRLAMRKQFPQFFQRVRKLKIGDKDYEAYGNLFLFRNPDKEAVKISRSFTSEEKSEKIDRWMHAASQGTILVSPFIGREEKQIRAEAERRGVNIILIIHEAFPERYKPAAHDFNLCTQGRLLIISLGLPIGTPLSRQHCLQMNELATMIADKN